MYFDLCKDGSYSKNFFSNTHSLSMEAAVMKAVLKLGVCNNTIKIFARFIFLLFSKQTHVQNDKNICSNSFVVIRLDGSLDLS